MKMRKTLSTFLISWTMFFGQITVTFAVDREELEREHERINQGRHEIACSAVVEMGLEIPGIDGLVMNNHETNCSVSRALNAGKERSGRYDSVGFCLEVEQMKNTAQSGCIIPTMDAASLNDGIESLRNRNEGLKNKEIEVKAKALRQHAEELNATAALQFGLSTDIKAVEHLFKMIWQEGQDPARRELFKNLFSLDDSFFSGTKPENSGYSVEEFISSAFQCLPYDTSDVLGKDGYESGIKKAIPSCREANLPGGSQEMLEAAKTKMMEECNEQGENCFFSGASDASGIFQELHQTIASRIGGQGSMYQGNPAFLAENLEGLQHLGQVHSMLGFISRDSAEPSMSDRLQGILEQARGRSVNSWDPGQGQPPADVVSSMRTQAFNSAVDIVLRESEGLKGESEEAVAKRNRFTTFLEKLKKDGHLENKEYTLRKLSEEFMTHFPGEEMTPADMEVMGYIQMVATGQRHADNMIEREIQMARTVSMVLNSESERTPAEATRRSRRGRRVPQGVTATKYDDFREDVNALLARTRENPSTDIRTVQRELGRIFGADNARSGLWAAMTRFEGLKDNSGSEAQALAFGARGVMSVMGKALWSVSKDEEKNGGPNGWSDEHKLKLIQLETLKNMAMRSAQTCNKLKQPSYKQGKFCSPLQDPEYANDALSNYIKQGFLDKGGNLDINEEKRLLSSALVYCAPILNAHEEKDLVQNRHYDPLSPQYAAFKFRQCQARTRTIFCSGSDSACDLNTPALEQQQIALFGQTCNSGSLESKDHGTRVGAGLATGNLDRKSGDVTFPDIESGKVSINETFNLEAGKKEDVRGMTTVVRGNFGSTYGYSNKSGYKRNSSSVGGPSYVNASSTDRLPDHFKSPMDAKVAPSNTFTGNNGAIAIDNSGETFMPVESITEEVIDQVLGTMTTPEEKDSELAKLLERLSNLEEQLASGSAKNNGGPRDETLSALEKEIKDLREKLARSSEFKEKLATINPAPRPKETPVEIDPDAFVNNGRAVRNNTASRGIASVASGGLTTSAPVNSNLPVGGGATGFTGGTTVREGEFTPRSNTAFFDGSDITLNRADLSGVTKSSLIKLVSNGKLRHDDVVRFVSDAAKNSEITENTRYVVTTEDGQILVYTPKVVNGQIEVEVSEYDPSQGGLDIASLDTVRVETTLADEEAGSLRAPASLDPMDVKYRNFQLECVLDGTCIETGAEIPTPLIQ